jgi:hypothetical protein
MITKITSAALPVSVAETANYLHLILPSASSTQELDNDALDVSGVLVFVIPDTSAAIQHSNDNTTWTVWQTITAAGYYTGGLRYIKTISSGCYVSLISLVNEETTKLTGLIGAATVMAEAELGRKIGSQQWKATYDDFPTVPFKLPLPDLIALDSVKYYDENGSEYIFANSNYIISIGSYPRFALKSGVYWPSITLQEIDGVIFEMTVGFTPSELTKLAIKEIVKYMYYGADDIPKIVNRLLNSSGERVMGF